MKTKKLRDNFELQTGGFNTSSQGFPPTRRRLTQWWAQNTPRSCSMFFFEVGFSIRTFKLAHFLTYLVMWSYDWVITVTDFSLGLQNVPNHMTYVTYICERLITGTLSGSSLTPSMWEVSTRLDRLQEDLRPPRYVLKTFHNFIFHPTLTPLHVPYPLRSL